MFIARDNDGAVYLIKERSSEKAYLTFAKEIWGEDIDDTGNVDIELEKIPKLEKKVMQILGPTV